MLRMVCLLMLGISIGLGVYAAVNGWTTAIILAYFNVFIWTFNTAMAD